MERAGYQPIGVDTSGPLLRLARNAAPSAKLKRASAYKVALPPCNAITCMGEVLSYHEQSEHGLSDRLNPSA